MTRQLIKLKNPIVSLDGDEMGRVMWASIFNRLISPFIDSSGIVYHDLSIEARRDSDDRVTQEAIPLLEKHQVGVKCATITPSKAQVATFKLPRKFPSPNGTIRNALDCAIFRTSVVVPGVLRPLVPSWVQPITIARHGYGDLYNAVEMAIPGPGRLVLRFEPAMSNSQPLEKVAHVFKGPGVARVEHNLDDSIRGFAQTCFARALDLGLSLRFGAKDTISPEYHGRFKDIFAEVSKTFETRFQAKRLTYEYALIDTLVSRVMTDSGGYMIALMNYDGDKETDWIAAGYGSLSMMTSELISATGVYIAEAPHGTVSRHYKDLHLKGLPTSTNPIASILAWSLAIKRRGELDQQAEVVNFALSLERGIRATLTKGKMTKDLVARAVNPPAKFITMDEFIDAVATEL